MKSPERPLLKESSTDRLGLREPSINGPTLDDTPTRFQEIYMNNEHCYDDSTLDTVLSILLVSAIGLVCSGLVAVMSGMQPIVA
jgi:hypothetical protein